MALTDKTLLAIERNPLNTENARSMARELRAARKVARAAKAWSNRNVPRAEGRLLEALEAYDKARKGGE